MDSKNSLIVGIILVIVMISAGFMYWPEKQMEVTEKVVEVTMIDGTVSGEYEIDSTNSKLIWSAKKPLLTNYVDSGTISIAGNGFTLTDGKLTGGSVVIDMNTINAEITGKKDGMDRLTKHLKSADFFNVEKYPTAKFTITETEQIDGTTVSITGDLTIKEITHPITFSAKIGMMGEVVKASADLTLDRTLWDIRYGSGKFFQNLGDKVIDDTFTLKLDITGVKKN